MTIWDVRGKEVQVYELSKMGINCEIAKTLSEAKWYGIGTDPI